MTDPYQVLGVARGASDEEIKKAYRNLSRRYHPDANVNNPNKAQAEERFKEVQQAYDQIMKEKQQGTSGSYAGYGTQGAQNRTQQGPFGGYSYGNSTYRSAEENLSPRMRAVLNYIRSGSYEEALHVLQDMPSNERNGRWYFYSAQAFQGLGNTAMAMDYIRQAVALEPSNMEYRQFQQQMQNGGEWYSNMGNTYRRPYGAYAGGSCMSLFFICMVFNCCCNCRPF